MRVSKTIVKKYKDIRLIGLEFENQLIYSNNNLPIKRKDIKMLWEKLITRDWMPIYDRDTEALVGIKKGINQEEIIVDTDTGVCNLEISLPPGEDLFNIEKGYKKVFSEIVGIAKKLGFTAISLGITPCRIKKDLNNLKTEKGPYLLFKDWLIRHNIQIPISAHQVCIDVKLAEMIRVMNCLFKVSGFITALTANSVIENGMIQNWKELRTLFWRVPIGNEVKNIENIFEGVPKKPFKDLSDYFRFIWDATPLIIMKNDRWVRLKDWRVTSWQYLTTKKEFKAITVDKKIIKIKSEEDDLNLMMALAWIDVKPHIVIDSKKIKLKDFISFIQENSLEKYLRDKTIKTYLEIRICSPGPKHEEMAIPAFLLGLINNLNQLEKFCSKLSWKEGRLLKDILSVQGMDYSFKDKSISFYLNKLIKISENGLKKRKYGEEKFLIPLYKRVQDEKNPADKTINLFKKEGLAGVIKFNKY